MEEVNRVFVLNNLSNKSSNYILNDLLNNADRIKLAMPSIDKCRSDIFILGDLSVAELEAYIITESLCRRANGTLRRIQEMNLDDSDSQLMEDRCKRLEELQLDLKKARDFMYGTIEERIAKEIQEVFVAQPQLIRQRFRWGDYEFTAGYVFVFFPQKIGITNRYPIGGD